jgi:hypothetical protein
VLVSSLTGTKADFDAACTDDNFAFLGQDNHFIGNQGIGVAPIAGTRLYIEFNNSDVSGGRHAIYANLTATNTSGTSTKYGLRGVVTAGVGYAGTGALIGSKADIDSSAAVNIPTAYGFSVSIANTGGATYGTVVGTYINDVPFTATNVYGTYANISVGAGRYNYYAVGAANFFGGDLQLGKTVTAAGSTGAQTINKTSGTVNFATAAASLVVTNSLVSASSIIICTVGTNDATMKSVQAVAGTGSFTIYPNAVPTAETRVNFLVTN